MIRGRLTCVIVGCKDSIVFALVGQIDQELVTTLCGVDEGDSRSETGEACVVQGLQKARQVGIVLGLCIGQGGGEGQDNSRGEENHASGRGEEDGGP